MRSTLEALPVQSMDMLSTEQLMQAWTHSTPVEFGDPTLSLTEFYLQQTFYPLGFPVLVSTNSQLVLDAATESWGSFDKLFDAELITLKIGVTEGGAPDCPPAPVCRIREHLCSVIANGENFAISDYDQAFSLIWVTRTTLDHPSYFRYFFLESTAMGQISNRSAWGIHAACVQLDGSGVLLCGDSGAGKSTLSYFCARAGWTYITDDGSYLVDGRDDCLIVGNCKQVRFRPAAKHFFEELHGREVMQRAEVGKPSIEFPTNAARQIVALSTSRIRHIVFLNRNTALHELVSFPAEVAKLYMLQRASCLPETRTRQAVMFNRLLEAGVYELRYTDLDWAVQRLTQLVREGC
jgi:hypothetical protein